MQQAEFLTLSSRYEEFPMPPGGDRLQIASDGL
jgi:hypothetical protein